MRENTVEKGRCKTQRKLLSCHLLKPRRTGPQTTGEMTAVFGARRLLVGTRGIRGECRSCGVRQGSGLAAISLCERRGWRIARWRERCDRVIFS